MGLQYLVGDRHDPLEQKGLCHLDHCGKFLCREVVFSTGQLGPRGDSVRVRRMKTPIVVTKCLGSKL